MQSKLLVPGFPAHWAITVTPFCFWSAHLLKQIPAWFLLHPWVHQLVLCLSARAVSNIPPSPPYTIYGFWRCLHWGLFLPFTLGRNVIYCWHVEYEIWLEYGIFLACSCHSWWQTGAQSATGAVGSLGWAAGAATLTWQFLMDSRE